MPLPLLTLRIIIVFNVVASLLAIAALRRWLPVDLAFGPPTLQPYKYKGPFYYILQFSPTKQKVFTEMPFFKVKHRERRLNTVAVKADSVRVITRLPPEGRTLRYFSLVGSDDTPKVPLTDAWLFGRGVFSKGIYRTFAIPVSRKDARVSKTLEAASRHSMIEITVDNSLSHNLIVRRVSSTLHGFGGEFVEFNGTVQMKKNGAKDGIRHLEASSFDEIWAGKWRSPKHLTAMESSLRKTAPGALVLDGHHQNCIEMRDRVKGSCEFDGKLSVVHRGGAWYLFSRANQQQQGGRYVQVAVSHSGPTGPYSRFEQLRIPGYKRGPDGNIYLLTANQNPLDEGQMIGLVPVNEGAPGAISVEGTHFNTDGEAYIALTLSCDGVHWLPLTKLVSSDGFAGRTLDHPVDGLAVGVHPDSVYFYIHRDVHGISPYSLTSAIVQHQFNPGFLRNLTRLARNTLQGCHSQPAPTHDSSKGPKLRWREGGKGGKGSKGPAASAKSGSGRKVGAKAGPKPSAASNKKELPHQPRGAESALPRHKKPIGHKKDRKGAKPAMGKPAASHETPPPLRPVRSEIRKAR